MCMKSLHEANEELQLVLFLSALIVWPIWDLTEMMRRWSTLTGELGWFPDVSAWPDKSPSDNNLTLILSSSLFSPTHANPSGDPTSEPKNKKLSGFLLLPRWRVRGSFVVSGTKHHTHLLTSWAYRKLSLAPDRSETGNLENWNLKILTFFLKISNFYLIILTFLLKCFNFYLAIDFFPHFHIYISQFWLVYIFFLKIFSQYYEFYESHSSDFSPQNWIFIPQFWLFSDFFL